MVASASVSSSPGKQGKCLSHCPIGLLERYADDVDVENNRQMASSAGPRLPMKLPTRLKTVNEKKLSKAGFGPKVCI